ncbi:sugar phosphate isomerase/epimerase family protein [Chelativorans sp. YIM 93263]|uniref:sugar phosphate isomerase/epimerase family protein n=1 Tax=Chelativorans sp. YIM 93263 TaxID=2906648 RepID=UPI002377DD58|nr:sugar phosphate isomerase/epimerase family protein [Chelativorans sp. YIM 93263]
MSAITHVGFNAADFGLSGDLDGLDHRIAEQVEMGATVCEIAAWRLDAVAACRLIPNRVSALKAVLQRHSIRYTMHAPIPVNLMDEAHFDLQYRAAEASLELASECNADTVVFHPGRVHPSVWVDRSRQLLSREAEALAMLGDRAASLGNVRIAYENMSPNRRIVAGTETSYALDLAALANQLRTVNHERIVACLDVSHAKQGAGLQGYDLFEQVGQLAPFVGHIHFSDSTGVPATMQWDNEGERLFYGVGDMHAPGGYGFIDFQRLAGVLSVREGTAVIIELRGNHYVHSGERVLEQAQDFASNVNRVQ